jgi:hypothetical protein
MMQKSIFMEKKYKKIFKPKVYKKWKFWKICQIDEPWSIILYYVMHCPQEFRISIPPLFNRTSVFFTGHSLIEFMFIDCWPQFLAKPHLAMR